MSGQTKKRSMDMLHGSIWNKLILYALPVAATGILEQLFNASDVAIVGNFTGEMRTVAVAAVGANSPIVGLLLNLFIGIALGANVVIAHAVGQGDEKTIHHAVHTAVIMAVAGGALVAVIEIGYTRLLLIFSAYTFTMLYENFSGYLRGFGISVVPAVLTIIGVCGVRLLWIFTAFPRSQTFRTIMMAYPISLSTTALLMFLALMWYRPARKHLQQS